MSASSDASGIVEHYRAKGWRGQALNQRVRKHARLLKSFDPDVAAALKQRVFNNLGGQVHR